MPSDWREGEDLNVEMMGMWCLIQVPEGTKPGTILKVQTRPCREVAALAA